MASDEPRLLTKWRLVESALRDPRLRAKSDVAVLQALIEFDRSGGCYPSNDTLADAANVTARTVRTAVKTLRDSGYVSYRRRGPTSAVYTITYHLPGDDTAPKDRKPSSGHGTPKDRKGASGHSDQRPEAERPKTGNRTSKDRKGASANSPYESAEDSAARAGAREAAAGEGRGEGEGSTSPASVPAEAPKARQGNRANKPRPANGSTAKPVRSHTARDEAIEQRVNTAINQAFTTLYEQLGSSIVLQAVSQDMWERAREAERKQSGAGRQQLIREATEAARHGAGASG